MLFTQDACDQQRTNFIGQTQKELRKGCALQFLINIVIFEFSFSMLTKLLISILCYAYNMLSKIEYVVTFLRSIGLT